jgi:hypothetical protein
MNTMKKFTLFIALLFLLTGTGFAADQTIKATEEMVGSGHATKTDTLNRLPLVEHNTDGTHKAVMTGLAITASKTLTVSQNVNLDEAVAMSSKAPKASPIFTGALTYGQVANGVSYLANSHSSVGVANGGSISYNTGAVNVAVLLFFIDYDSGIIGIWAVGSGTFTKVIDPSNYFTTTNTGKWTISTADTGATITMTNNFGANRTGSMNIIQF